MLQAGLKMEYPDFDSTREFFNAWSKTFSLMYVLYREKIKNLIKTRSLIKNAGSKRKKKSKAGVD